MTTDTIDPSSLSDADLLSTARLAAGTERESTARLVALLAEVDTRRLYLGEGYSSMFAWCTRALHLSEHAAYARIEAARVAQYFPWILERLGDGRLSLTTIGLLAPHLTELNVELLLDAAEHKSKRDVERLIAGLHPQPDIPTSVRALPLMAASIPERAVSLVNSLPLSTTTAARSTIAGGAVPLAQASSPPRSVVAPLAPRRYLLRVTIDEDTHRKLEHARDLLRHDVPDGDLTTVIDRALTLLVAHAERTMFAAATGRSRPQGSGGTRPRSRRLPAAVRRAIWARDQGRCAFTGHDSRCGETTFLEFHHIIPFALGGSNSLENLELRCRAHNAYEAERAGLGFVRQPATRSGPS